MGCSHSTEVDETKRKPLYGKVSQFSNIDIRKNFEYVYMLGNGSFGKVRLYRNKANKSSLYAIKTLKKEGIPYYEFKLIKSRFTELSEFIKDVRFMRNLNNFKGKNTKIIIMI